MEGRGARDKKEEGDEKMKKRSFLSSRERGPAKGIGKGRAVYKV